MIYIPCHTSGTFKTIRLLSCLLLVLIVTACASMDTITDTATTSDEGSSSSEGSLTDEGSSSDDGDLGTIVGNPNGTKTSYLTVKTVSTDSTQALALGAAEGCEIDSDPDTGNPDTQTCRGTPQEYHAGITSIYLVSCLDAVGADVTCDSPLVASIAARTPVNTQALTNLVATDSGTTLELSLAELAQEKNFGGLQIVTNNIGQKFPGTDSADREMIAMHLLGKAFQVCTSPDDVLTDEEMTSVCGYADARRGDLLFDMNDDDVYGYIDTSTFTADTLTETGTRPEDYGEFVSAAIADGVRGFTSHYQNEYTDGDGFGAVAGYFAPIIAFTAVTALSPETSYNITVTIDIRDTFQFVDGIRNHDFLDVCVSALAMNGCPNGDDDPSSVGYYNPYYDGVFILLPPTTTVTVEE